MPLVALLAVLVASTHGAAAQETQTAFDKAWAGADVRLADDLYTGGR